MHSWACRSSLLTPCCAAPIRISLIIGFEYFYLVLLSITSMLASCCTGPSPDALHAYYLINIGNNFLIRYVNLTFNNKNNVLKSVICEGRHATFSHLSCRGCFGRFSQLGHLDLLHTAHSDSNTFFYMVESFSTSLNSCLCCDVIPFLRTMALEIFICKSHEREPVHFSDTGAFYCYVPGPISAILYGGNSSIDTTGKAMARGGGKILNHA